MAMCLFAAMILYKGSVIYMKEGKELKSLADSLHTKIETLHPERGNIYSEDGSLLSSSIPEFDLRIDMKAIPKDTFDTYIESLSKSLSIVLKEYTWTEYKEMLSKEYNNGNRYYLLKRKASYAEYLEIKTMKPFDKGQNKGGFIAEANTKRINPFGLLANRAVGLYRKNAQNIGIERRYNQYLEGTQGQRILRKIAGGTWMPIDGSEIDPENGKDVITTLDVNIQDVAENALLKQVEKEQATFGTCIVMEVKTGKIKAIANLGRRPNGTYGEDYNYAYQRIEPGSTFKLTSLISLFRDSLIKIDDKVNCEGGKWRVGPYTIHDSHAGLGVLSIKDAFAHSSNVAFAKLIYTNYKDRPASYWTNLHMLGLDRKTGLDLDGESLPRFTRDTVTKTKYSLAFMGQGYSVMITPLHTCMVYNMIANQGKMMKPYLVNSIREYGKDIINFKPVVMQDQLLNAKSLVQIKEAMNEVVETGTGKELKNPFYKICGKTGTAQVADKGIRYSDRVYHGSFVGFFPKEDPQYTICVVLRTRKGSSNYYGGLIALPVFKEVANRLYATKMKSADGLAKSKKVDVPLSVKSIQSAQYNVLASKLVMAKKLPNSPSWLQNIHIDSSGNLTYHAMQNSQSMVPDVNGMGMRDAIYVLEKAGLKVIPQGKGKVIAQSIAPGAMYYKGQKITLQLS
ncbi:MAG: transpeptidase family protein [Bacteroidetes bacterium]|nr:transpeptidase family protein [Bacteroidota bacterium]